MSAGTEQRQSQEKLKQLPTFSRMVLGHPLSEVDIDQVVAYAVARKMKLLAEGATIECKPFVPVEDLRDTSALKVEGFDSEQVLTHLNQHQSGSFHNGSQDQPAAFMLWKNIADSMNPAALGQQVDKNTRNNLNALVAWLYRAETGSDSVPFNETSVLRAADLSVLVKIIEGIKISLFSAQDLTEANRSQHFFEQLDELLDQLFDADAEPLSETYREVLQQSEALQQTNRQKLAEHFAPTSQPELQSIVSAQGHSVSFADIRGTGVRYGGPKQAVEAVSQKFGRQTDILIFVADEYGEGTEPIEGKSKLFLKIPKEKSGQVAVDFSEIAARLNVGVAGVDAPKWGGHSEFLGSPQFVGTDEEPTVFLEKIRSFLDVPRYSAQEFEKLGQRLQAALGADVTVRTFTEGKPKHSYSLPERVLEIKVQSDRGETILLSEIDLRWYASYLPDGVVPDGATYPDFSDNVPQIYDFELHGQRPRTLLEILQNKNTKPEHTFTEENHRVWAEEHLPRALERSDGVQVLECISYLPLQSVRLLSPQRCLEIYECISQSAVAISQVWDSQDDRFGMGGINTAEWMGPRERFTYQETLQSKVDSIITSKATEFALTGTITRHDIPFLSRFLHADFSKIFTDQIETPFFQSFLFSIKAVLESSSYIDSHRSREVQWDSQLLYFSYLLLSLDNNSQINRSLDTFVSRVFGIENGSVWFGLQYHPQILDQLAAQYPKIGEVLEELGLSGQDKVSDETQVEVLDEEPASTEEDAVQHDFELVEGLSEAKYYSPSRIQVEQTLTHLQSIGSPLEVTFLMQGGRKIADNLQRDGLFRLGKSEQEQGVPLESIEATLDLDGTFGLANTSADLDQSQMAIVNRKILEGMRDLLVFSGEFVKDTEKELPKVRLAITGAPNQLMVVLSNAFDQLPIQIQDRILLCQYDQQEARYIDVPYREFRAFAEQTVQVVFGDLLNE